MKKLEELLERLRLLFDIEEERLDGVIGGIPQYTKRTPSAMVGKIIFNIISTIILLVMLLALIGFFLYFAIIIAIESNNYLLLSIMTSLVIVLIMNIVKSFFEKDFFEKLNSYLRETPKATALIFWIIYAVVLVLSWKYFIGFIFSVILAFMAKDYIC